MLNDIKGILKDGFAFAAFIIGGWMLVSLGWDFLTSDGWPTAKARPVAEPYSMDTIIIVLFCAIWMVRTSFKEMNE